MRTQPRRGSRVWGRASAITPLGTLLLYSCHLENATGPTNRMIQFAEVLGDADNQLKSGISKRDCEKHSTDEDDDDDDGGGEEEGSSTSSLTGVIIGGDLNTLQHSFYRFVPQFSDSRFRWASWGLSEATLWDKLIFSGHTGVCVCVWLDFRSCLFILSRRVCGRFYTSRW